MSELPVQNSPNYVEQHPNAVQNVELAHTMALAGNVHEARAADTRQRIAAELGEATVDPNWGASLSAGSGRQPMEQKVDEAVSKIGQEQRSADALYSNIETAHDRLEATRR